MIKCNNYKVGTVSYRDSLDNRRLDMKISLKLLHVRAKIYKLEGRIS